MPLPTIPEQREFLKDTLRQQINFTLTDQHRGLTAPPLQRPPRKNQTLIPLPDITNSQQAFKGIDLLDAIANRQSQRRFLAEPLTMEELGLLLWATQGIREQLDEGCAMRTVPSAGCRHAFECYLLVSNITGLDHGVYRYLPIEHAVIIERNVHQFSEELAAATFHQNFIAQAPLTLVWTTIPYRMEWRYDIAAHRVIAIDAGHVCQNLYLACQAIGAGTCAIAAYDQQRMDELLGVDGEEEFTLYLAPVGKV